MAGLRERAQTAISEILTHDALREQAMTDPLTGLGNRRQLAMTLADRHAQATQAPAEPWALMVFDLRFPPARTSSPLSEGVSLTYTQAAIRLDRLTHTDRPVLELLHMWLPLVRARDLTLLNRENGGRLVVRHLGC
jgi:hypothetical protein